MIYAASFPVSPNTVVEVFAELGISPGRYVVTLQRNNAAAPDLQITQDAAGSASGCFLPVGNEGSGSQSSWALSFTTDRDPVYVKHNGALDALGNGPFAEILYVVLSAA